MGKIKGFMEFDRIKEPAIAPKRRIKNYKEFTVALKLKNLENKELGVWIVVYRFVIVDAL